jgi:Domain of unknown function (DUF4186)
VSFSVSEDELERRLAAVPRQPFRARFHLRGRDRATVELRGMDAIRRHAHELIERRLAPAAPAKDGKQTPYRGHPVFVAQHATATCCRSCLARNHAIPPGQPLSSAERDYVVEVICRWIERDFEAQSGGSLAPR